MIRSVWLSYDALNFIEKEAIRPKTKETGGILMGYQVGQQAVITIAIGPGPKAEHNHKSFIPDQKFHVSEIERVYSASERTITYLGDWHSHPKQEPYLSHRDKLTFAKIANHKPARLPNPLMVVVGTEPFKIKIWSLRKGLFGRNEIIECILHIFQPEIIG
jgi:integrative and conjugative element protein (TIGR02256 family)